MRYKYSEDDIIFLKENYPIGNWDKIHNRFPFLSDSAIHHKCSRMGIKFDYSKRNNQNMFINRHYWTDKELDIMIKYYSEIPIEELQTLLPGRTKSMIQNKANILNLKSFATLQSEWKDCDIVYLKTNWELTPDVIIAKELNRTQRAVQAKRLELGLYRMYMDSNSYPSLSKYLRGHNLDWKKNSMKHCDYKCVLTGSKDFEIHHLYGVSNIITDILNDYPNYKNISFDSLLDEDLQFILRKFIEYQSAYPLGECVKKELHVLFHSLYGQYYNTPEQWYRFKEDYRKGVYKQIA